MRTEVLDISVCGEVNSLPRFKEAFLSLDLPIPIYDTEICGDNRS